MLNQIIHLKRVNCRAVNSTDVSIGLMFSKLKYLKWCSTTGLGKAGYTQSQLKMLKRYGSSIYIHLLQKVCNTQVISN